MAKQVYTTGQILTAAQMTTLQANDYNQTVSAKTTSYTLVAADVGTRITMNSASATTITVNTAIFAAGDTLEITNIGAGVCTVTAGTATVSTSSTLALKQFDSGQLYFTSTGVSIFFMADAADAGASPLTTKGDLYTFSTADARLPVGTNGQTLVANSSAATGLAYIGNAYSSKTAAYTFASGDEGDILSMNNAATQQFNIPTDATFNFAVGTEITVFWISGAGQPTIGAVTPATTTVISTGAVSATPKLRVVNSGATCVKLAANSWIVFGDIS